MRFFWMNFQFPVGTPLDPLRWTMSCSDAEKHSFAAEAKALLLEVYSASADGGDGDMMIFGYMWYFSYFYDGDIFYDDMFL